MSIYSGFATRRDESKYNGLLAKLIERLQDHLLELADQEQLKKKVVGYSKIVSRMREFEEHKYLPPKFSELLDPLCRAMGISVGAVGAVGAVEVPGETAPERYCKIKSERDAKGAERFSNCKTKFQTKIMGDLLDFGKGANKLRKESTH